MIDDNGHGVPSDARYDRAAMDFMDATIALSDLDAKFAAASPPMRPAPELPTDSVWGEVEAANQTVGYQVAAAAEALRARVAISAVENAQEAVEFGLQNGISVPPHIVERPRAGQGG
jgi:hypothetical protein